MARMKKRSRILRIAHPCPGLYCSTALKAKEVDQSYSHSVIHSFIQPVRMDHSHSSNSNSNSNSSNQKLAAGHPNRSGSSSSSSSSSNDRNPATTSSNQLEEDTVRNYHPPLSMAPAKRVDWVYTPSDGSVLCDHNSRPISVGRLLATKPLRGELSTRPGPGNKKLTYLSGEGVTRTLNDIFGFDGWNLDITKVEREECLKQGDKFTVCYSAMVRLTHKASGAYKEDCGAGDSTDRSFGTAVSHALKASITDALKRAARHFGDKLGNSLYQGNFSINKAPVTLKDALDRYDIERANCKFGFPKDNQKQVQQVAAAGSAVSASATNGSTSTVVTSIPQQQQQQQQQEQPKNPASGGATNHPNSARILPPSGPPTKESSVPSQQPKSNANQSSSTWNNRPNQSVVAPVQRGQQQQQQQQRPSQPPSSKPISSNAAAPPPGHHSSANNSSSTNRQQQNWKPSGPVVPPQQQAAAPPQQHHQAPPLMPPVAAAGRAPPPTPMDSLRNSALFSSSFSMEEEEELSAGAGVGGPAIPPRPQSSHGHTAARSTTTGRHSIGDGRPIQPPPLVTPTTTTTTTGGARPNQQQPPPPPYQHAHNNKRPALNALSGNYNVDPTLTKKASTNPYSAGVSGGNYRSSY